MSGERIRIRGTVQGVGFRPTIWKFANDSNLTGKVCNDSEGVLVHVFGEQKKIDSFIKKIAQEHPPLAIINSIERSPLKKNDSLANDFQIEYSRSDHVSTDIRADAATCPLCFDEIVDAKDRRYRYPFGNCTHCGPRFSIIDAIPYDRKNTAMANFKMCPSCLKEYEQPTDRRFHAQPNACPDCGPNCWIEDKYGRIEHSESYQDVIAYAKNQILQGKIIAIKGVGGFHLVCRADQDNLISRLRRKKNRPDKPLALIVRSVDAIKKYAQISLLEEQLLTSHSAPIVLVKKNNHILSSLIAPNNDHLGFILPYTPLHHLLLKNINFPLIFTSANYSNEPQIITNDLARIKLTEIADLWLMHNRDIRCRLDDSVQKIVNDQPLMIRRARGYVPEPFSLHSDFKDCIPILAMGAELKNSFCFVFQGKAILSQPMGDLKSISVFEEFKLQIEHYTQLFKIKPELIASDLHPNFLSTRYAYEMSEKIHVPVVQIQHHHAHIAAVMAEHGMGLKNQQVLGVALDGMGLGSDGSLWGGEFLLADYCHYKRVAFFQPVPLLGGNKAALEPWRNLLAHLLVNEHLTVWLDKETDIQALINLKNKPVELLSQALKKGINSPLSSSVGRLFDAVAASLDICHKGISYEGQAAIELEVMARQSMHLVDSHYPYDWHNNQLMWGSMWQELFNDLLNDVEKPIIAAKFHLTMIHAIVRVIMDLSQRYAIKKVVLTGGVFQNEILLQGVKERLSKQLELMSASVIPMNDSGIALGQAVICTARQLNER